MNLDLERVADALERYAAGLRTGDEGVLRLADLIDRCHRQITSADSAVLALTWGRKFFTDLRLSPDRYAPAELVSLLVETHGPMEPGRAVSLSAFKTVLEALRAFSIVERTSLGSPTARRLRATTRQTELERVRAFWTEQDPRPRLNAEERPAAWHIAETICRRYAENDAPDQAPSEASPHLSEKRSVIPHPSGLREPDPGPISTADDFHAALTALRERAGLTIRQIASELQRSAAEPVLGGTLSDWFSGRHLPGLKMYPLLADVLTLLGVRDAAERARWKAALERARSASGPPVRQGSGNINVYADARLTYRVVLAIDIEKYSARDARGQLNGQTDLRNIVGLAAQNVGLDRSLWYEQVSGDGELAVLPEDVDVSLVVGDFTQQLESILGEFNRKRPGERRLRLRAALHHGTLTPGPFGPAGDAPIVVSRLLDAKPLRRFLTDHQDRDVALIVSQTLYQDVVRTGFCSLDPDEFQPVRVNAKGVAYHGFVQRAMTRESTDSRRRPPTANAVTPPTDQDVAPLTAEAVIVGSELLWVR